MNLSYPPDPYVPQRRRSCAKSEYNELLGIALFILLVVALSFAYIKWGPPANEQKVKQMLEAVGEDLGDGLKKKTVDGHVYIINEKTGGMVHAESCPCKQQ